MYRVTPIAALLLVSAGCASELSSDEPGLSTAELQDHCNLDLQFEVNCTQLSGAHELLLKDVWIRLQNKDNTNCAGVDPWLELNSARRESAGIDPITTPGFEDSIGPGQWKWFHYVFNLDSRSFGDSAIDIWTHVQGQRLFVTQTEPAWCDQ